jgi:hypothetical protein
MLLNAEVAALLSLLEDPDEQVYEQVKNKLLSYGPSIITNLEDYYSDMTDARSCERIEQIIHTVNYQEIVDQLYRWTSTGALSLKDFFILIAKYRFQNLDLSHLRNQLVKIYQSVWLEMNIYLTPVEHQNVLSSIIHNMYRLEAIATPDSNMNHHFINYLLDNRVGSEQALFSIYLILIEQLELSIKPILIGRIPLLAYFDEVVHFHTPNAQAEVKILFYIDPKNGMIYTQTDVDVYLKKIDYEDGYEYQKPLTNQEVAIYFLKEVLIMLSTKELINDQEKEMIHLIEIIENS